MIVVTRVHPQYWRTRLRQYKAAGLNTVDVYVPWNLHEPQRGVFDFGDGGSQFSPFLNITRLVAVYMGVYSSACCEDGRLEFFLAN